MVLVLPIQIRYTIDSNSWNEDFNDFNSSKWDFQSYGRDYFGFFYPLKPRISISDGILRAYNSSSLFDIDMALTESKVAIGTWEFDWNFPKGNINCYYYDSISLLWTDMTGKYNLAGLTGNMMNYAGYSILLISEELDEISWSPGIKLYRWNEKNEGPMEYYLGSAIFNNHNLSTYHFEITRDYSGLFTIHVENKILIKAEDNNVTSSEKFSFASFCGNSGIDNISVTNIPSKISFLK